MSQTTQRLFFALWPGASVSEALATLAQQVGAESGGRATAPGKAHLTLAFLGDQPRRIARELSVAASRISTPAFDLVFDRLDCWRNSAVAWAGVESVPSPLLDLHQAVGRLLRDSGLEREERPFAVHVTLARHIATTVRRPLAAPIVWHVSRFALVASDVSPSGARYRVLSSWPLDADNP